MAIYITTKEKTNWKYLSVVFALGFVAGAWVIWVTNISY